MTRHLGDNMTSVLIAIALFGLTVYFLTSRKRRNTPPAIRGRLPILGNILQFRGAQPFYILTKWAEKYGPIYTLRIGAINAVVLTSGDLAKEALVTKYGSFPSKHMTTALTIATQDKKMLPTLDYGPHYNALKRHMVTHLLGPIPQKENRVLRHELIIRMINGMFEDMPSDGRVVNMSAIVNNLLFELALRQVLGFAPKEMYVAELGFLNREQIYKILVQDLLELGLQFDWRNYWPMLSWVPNKKKENIWNETARRRDLVCEELWKMYKKQFALTGPTGCYADNINEDDETFKIKENLIPMIIWELVLESVDTVSVASEWIIYELARNPQVQERLYQEIKSVAGDRMVNEDDMRNLPYLDAIIKETLRVYNPVPVLIPRIPAEDITLGGYDIPKGWDVIVNQWGIGRDKTRWPDADVWDPERCLRDSSIDLGIKDFKITPFGGGKRMCPGIQQGVSMISLEVCGIVQHFEFSFPPNEGNTDAEISMVTFTTRKATPMLAYIKARVKNILPA
ncbi:protein MpKOL2 [Marchantia polymorpha subsp. ruderalis]|nr:hypothetical protein MARPO_0130s0003 [Marchantia polymorpha]BBN00769.1 hypothetical protein Mp_2g01950 [Marchantia polymorpha subsp. ruderalis]|eukprot:PTQ30046.1 hypothetical protein MARPO_0130s0003 [Marchantia polymorpha]